MAPEKLDVEDDEERQKRLQSLLERINTPGSSAIPTQPLGPPKFDFGDRTTFEVAPNTELLSRLQTFLPQMQASNEALLKRAAEDPDSVDIENITEGAENVIEMDLGLGLFEQRNDATTISSDSDEDDSMSDSTPSSSSSSSSTSSFSSSSSSSDHSDALDDSEDSSDPGQRPTLDQLLRSFVGRAGDDDDDDDDYDSDTSSESIACHVSNRPTRPLPKRTLNQSAPSAASASATMKPMIVVLNEKPNAASESI